jgi:hypothetical protein
MRPATALSEVRSCSQNRSTVHPWRRSSALVALSRLRFLEILLSQYETFELGNFLQRGQPCQKHPSVKITSRSARNTKSGDPGKSPGLTCQPRKPLRTSSPLSRHSVERLRWDRTCAITRERIAGDTVSIFRLLRRVQQPARSRQSRCIAALQAAQDAELGS